MIGEVVDFIYLLMDTMGGLMLTALGLLIIFGMMGVINMAHGELMMIGAYVTASLFHSGVPLFIAVFCGGFGAGFLGVIMERLIVRHFYNQLLSSLVVTWGVSLVLSQGFLNLFGPSLDSISRPFGSLDLAGGSYSYYNLLVFGVAVAAVAGIWGLFGFTRYGERVRATMEDPKMAEALGVRTAWVYAATFGLGSFLAGIAGGVLAVGSSITPFFGQDYTAMAFISVVLGGGANVLVGVLSSPGLLALINTLGTILSSAYLGYIAMMASALVLLVSMPKGISDWIEGRRLQS